MYAVVTTGGKQYRVEPGATLIVERLAAEPGATVTFDRVLLVGDGDDVTVGTPTVSGASVSGTVLGEELGPKIVIFKFKQKVKYRRRTGHRQHLTRVRIDAIEADGRTTRAEAEEKPQPAATAKPARKPRTASAKSAAAKSASARTASARTASAKAAETDEQAAPAKKPRTRKAAGKPAAEE